MKVERTSLRRCSARSCESSRNRWPSDACCWRNEAQICSSDARRDFGFGQRSRGGIALLAQIFQRGGDFHDLLAQRALAGFEFGGLLGERGAFLRAFLFLRGEALDFVNDGVDLLVQQPLRSLQRVEFALMRGDGHFLLAQFGLRLLKTGLQRSLFTEQRALVAAQFIDLFLRLGDLRFQFGDLIFAAEDGAGGLAGTIAGTAGIDAVAGEQFRR